jgi:putative transposase
MGRLARTVGDGLIYHAINRGNNRGDVLTDEADRIAFLEALAKTKERYPFRLFGYCLMTNHFHLLLRPEAGQSISRILQSLAVAHTWRYHKRHHTTGHVWQGRFKSPVIQDDSHLLVVLRYIEANPLRAKMIRDLADYPWSSFPCHCLGQEDPLLSPFPEWEELGRSEAERRRRWRAKVCAVQSEAELIKVRASLQSGRPFGTSDWTEQLAERLNIELIPRPRGRPRKQQSTGAADK